MDAPAGELGVVDIVSAPGKQNITPFDDLF
jgi:hypothetical protein